MNGNESIEETVTRTFRINKEWDNILIEEANWQGISVSALLDQIVRKFVVMDRFQNNSSLISIDSNAFIGILQKIKEEDILDLGKDIGILLPEEELLKRGLPHTFQSIVWMMKEVYGRYRGWFKVDHYTTKDHNILHLRHYLNSKWSVYLSNLFSAMFKANLDIEINTEIREESTTLYIPNKQIKTNTRAYLDT